MKGAFWNIPWQIEELFKGLAWPAIGLQRLYSMLLDVANMPNIFDTI